MPSFCPGRLYIALVHYPVIDKNGLIVASAVTNLDIHDIARAAKTYGVSKFFVVTPVSDQRALSERIISHWTSGAGSVYNPDRRDALSLVRLSNDVAEVVSAVEIEAGERPVVAATDARQRPDPRPETAVRELLAAGRPVVLLLGTAWGLSDEVIERADMLLAPIQGGTSYNHLSVRSAAAIYLDRILGRMR